MNRVDLGLMVIGALCALRGYWRGFFREGFGIVALVAGVAAAFRWTQDALALAQAELGVPTAVLAGIAFVGLFTLVYAVATSIGFVVDWMARGTIPAVVNGGAGAVLGAAKFVLVASAALLFVELLPVVPAVPTYIRESLLARPLSTAASRILRSDAGQGPVPSADPRS